MEQRFSRHSPLPAMKSHSCRSVSIFDVPNTHDDTLHIVDYASNTHIFSWRATSCHSISGSGFAQTCSHTVYACQIFLVPRQLYNLSNSSRAMSLNFFFWASQAAMNSGQRRVTMADESLEASLQASNAFSDDRWTRLYSQGKWLG